jgi:hypothetical protein
MSKKKHRATYLVLDTSSGALDGFLEPYQVEEFIKEHYRSIKEVDEYVKIFKAYNGELTQLSLGMDSYQVINVKVHDA